MTPIFHLLSVIYLLPFLSNIICFPSESFHMIFLSKKSFFFFCFLPIQISHILQGLFEPDVLDECFTDKLYQVHSLCISITLNGFNHVYVIVYLHIYLSISVYVSDYLSSVSNLSIYMIG